MREGFGFHQALGQLLPHALGHQVVHFAAVHHGAHQLQGFGCHREVGKTRRQARHPQNTHRVFAKSLGHMAQHLACYVTLAAKRVHQRARSSPSLGVGRALGIKSASCARGICANSY
jgi:hypothetical protein